MKRGIGKAAAVVVAAAIFIACVAAYKAKCSAGE